MLYTMLLLFFEVITTEAFALLFTCSKKFPNFQSIIPSSYFTLYLLTISSLNFYSFYILKNSKEMIHFEIEKDKKYVSKVCRILILANHCFFFYYKLI